MSLIGSAGSSVLQGQTILDGVPVNLSVNTDNLLVNPDTFTSIDFAALAAVNVTGLQGARKNRFVVLVNKGVNAVTLVDTSSSSLAANRFNLGGANIVMAQNAIVVLIGTTSIGWILLSNSAAGGGAGSGTVTDVTMSVPNDFAESVSNPTTTPNIVLTHGPLLSVTLAAGQSNDYNPGAPFPVVARLNLNPSTGDANLTGLIAGQDGQMLLLSNISATNNLTLDSLNAGSAAANQFRAAADLTLPPRDAKLLFYNGGSINKWVVAS